MYMCVLLSVCVCNLSRLCDPVTGQEGLAQVLVVLLVAVLSSQSHRVTQSFLLKYPFEGLIEEAVLESTSLFRNPRQHLSAAVGRLIKRTWISDERHHRSTCTLVSLEMQIYI